MITKKPEQLIFGVAALVVGGGFLLEAVNVIDFGKVFSTWWPVLLIIAAIVTVWSSRENWLWAVLLAAAGGILLAHNLDLWKVNVWQIFWPLVIVGVGLAMLFNGGNTRLKVSKAKRTDLTAILGATTQKNDSSEFVGGKLTSIMGSAVLDLRKAKIPKEAVIEVFSFWGAVEIYLPKDVAVKNEVMSIMAGVENKADPETNAKSSTVTIIGQAIMAGVELRN